jgi:glutamate dehydrogenase/leucine dehydrogenase
MAKARPCAIQGFGNVGSFTAKFWARARRQSGRDHRREGRRVQQGRAGRSGAVGKYWLRDKRTVAGFPGSEPMNNQDLFGLDVDCLIPAALGDVITGANCTHIKAKLVIEGANHPTQPDADEDLHERGIVVIPDILANAGGVTVSYFEWTQNLTSFYWDEDKVNRELEIKMRRAFMDVHEMARKEKCSYAHGGLHAGHQARGRSRRTARQLAFSPGALRTANGKDQTCQSGLCLFLAFSAELCALRERHSRAKYS